MESLPWAQRIFPLDPQTALSLLFAFNSIPIILSVILFLRAWKNQSLRLWFNESPSRVPADVPQVEQFPEPVKAVSAQEALPRTTGKPDLPSAEQTALLIRKRRSIYPKDFTGAALERGIVEAMLEAANWAPTHGKSEPWRFVVLSEARLQEFITAMVQAIENSSGNPHADRQIAKLNSKRKKLKPVTWAVVICFKRQAGEKLMPEWEELAATAAAVQNLHLMGTALGAAGYWTSWGPEEARDSLHVKDWLGIEPQDRCLGVFLLGSSDRVDDYRASRGPVSEKVVWRI